METKTQGILITSQYSSSDEDDDSDIEQEQRVGSTAKVFAARVIAEDPPQSPFGDKMRPIFLDMLPNDEPDDEQETRNTIELQPKAIVIDDYEITRERPEPIV